MRRSGPGKKSGGPAKKVEITDQPNDMHKAQGRKSRRKQDDKKGRFPLPFTLSLVGIVLIGVVFSIVYRGYLETRIHTPHDTPKVLVKSGLDVPSRFWGTYRSGVYFGLKHRTPKSVALGLMWLQPAQMRPGDPKLRHLCQQGDNLRKYGWLMHDGVNFGIQEITDEQMKLTTSFVKREGGKHGGDWTARIVVETIGKVTKPNEDEILLFFYLVKEPGQDGTLDPEQVNQRLLTGIRGQTPELGNFLLRFENSGKVIHSSKLVTRVASLNHISDISLRSMEASRKGDRVLYGFQKEDLATKVADPNLIVYQVHVKTPFTLEVAFESSSFFNRPSSLTGVVYSETLEEYKKTFDTTFEETFHLQRKKFNNSEIEFGKAALSNLVGGIGYFTGNSRVQSIYNENPVAYWTASLYTAVPSRSFFPRGFLWDEGFHLLLLNKWSPEISLDIISHWLDLMNVEGWIPREEILGEEAQIRVPEEYVVQRNDVANPPTLIIALADLLGRHGEWLLQNHKDTLGRMWPRLTSWFNWLNRTQGGEIPTTYRWRGRNETTRLELNPKTLASGLDDYPRASHPSVEERHLDLRCWMAVSSKLMRDLAELIGHDSQRYEAMYEALADPELLDVLHWSDELGTFADFGLHSRAVRLVSEDTEPRRQGQPPPPTIMVRKVDDPPTPRFVNAFGYLSLFPMLLRLLRADSERLGSLLERLDDPNLLWTPFGLRSLAASAPLYKTRNTEHDPPYWRNPIWININFLALKALKTYSEEAGPFKAVALSKYEKLREGVMRNVMREYWRTGYIWEQYDDKTGEGKGCRPFTGWSSLVLLIMAEDY